MIQAARLAPAIHFVPVCHEPCFLPSLRSGPVESSPTGAGACGPKDRATGRSLARAFASGVECPAGTPLHPWAPAITSAAADGGSVSRSACAPALGSGRFAPCGGAAWPLAARNRGLAPMCRGDRTPAEQPRGPLRASRCVPSAALNAGTDAAAIAPPLNGSALSSPTVAALRAPIISARPTPRVLRCAAKREPPRTAFASCAA